jgi:hypothetical protein
LKHKLKNVLRLYKWTARVQGSKDQRRSEGSIESGRNFTGIFIRERPSWSHFQKGIPKGAKMMMMKYLHKMPTL